MSHTVKNVHTAPVGVHAAKGYVAIAPGNSVTADFSDKELASMETNSLLEIEKPKKAKPTE